jgi:hypothetical protein
MSAQAEHRIRLAGAILAILVGVVAAPVLDDIVGFFSEAPYVRYLPIVLERVQDASGVLTSAVDGMRDVWAALPLRFTL